ncbi:MAG: hypothetical protein COV67_02450 [Nitrospinae bacterium CG11_big_fil_rev_8_21_14_0_20_56_8]|nr:MAG: hypothetical protein COV67_02450 [Nitrospinae bacterium CG11_big_fil_rev_8_21_14_0_20_56_8]
MIELVFFPGCPLANQIRTWLINWRVPFREICQDTLEEGHPMQNLTSPSLLRDGEILLGENLGAPGAGCTWPLPDAETLRKTISG